MRDDKFRKFLKHAEQLTVQQRERLLQSLTEDTGREEVVERIERRNEQGLKCPHCRVLHLQRWGTANGLQRYRCCNCGKTFNGLTGTPLARLNHKASWLDYMATMIDGHSIRKAAVECNVHRTTSFRWRHRFLTLPRELKDGLLNGIVEADETYFLESFKGSRHLSRAPRKRGGKAKKRGLSAEQIPVLIVRDRYGATTDSVLENVTEKTVGAVLTPVLASDALLCTDGARVYRALAEHEGIEHRALMTSQRERVKDRVFHIQNVNAYDSRLKAWMARFKGVATCYLPNYLGWRRLLEKHGPALTPQAYLAAAMG